MLAEALQFVRGMSVRPDTTTYNSLIRIAVSEGNMEAAEHLAQAIGSDDDDRRTDLEPTTVTFTTLLSGYGAVGRLKEAEDIFYRRLPDAGLRPSAVTYTALASAYLTDQRPEEARHVLEVMATEAMGRGELNPDRSWVNVVLKVSFDGACLAGILPLN